MRTSVCILHPTRGSKLSYNRGCIFGGIFNFFKVLWFFISFNCFLFDFNGFNWFKLLFGPIRFEIHQVSAQMVDSRPESWHFGKLAHGLLGWGTTLRELKVPSGIAPLKNKICFKPPNCRRIKK